MSYSCNKTGNFPGGKHLLIALKTFRTNIREMYGFIEKSGWKSCDLPHKLHSLPIEIFRTICILNLLLTLLPSMNSVHSLILFSGPI